jgi:PAS domain S-box-containing protein
MSAPEPDSLSGVFDAVDVGLIVLDQTGRITGWNTWIAVAAAVPAAQAIGRRIGDIFPELQNGRLATAVGEALDAGSSSILTYALHAAVFPLKTRAGRDLIHNVAISPLAGESARCLIQVSDVTVAVERDKVLRERQNARYDAVVDGAPDAILTLDINGAIQMANPAAAKEFGYPGATLVGEPAAILFQDQEAWTTAWETLLRGDLLVRPVELDAHRKDGSISYVEMSASRWNSASRVFVTAILRDVNERRAVREELRTLNQTLEGRVAERTADRDRMWRLSTDIMLVAKPDGQITATNPAWSYLLGWPEDNLSGRRLQDLVIDEDQPLLIAALVELVASGAPRLVEVRIRHRAGGDRVIALSAVAVDGLIQGVGRDVTAERQAQAALRQTEEALRQSQKMEAIGQLTGGIAHDFNNLLTGIIGAVEIVRKRLASGNHQDIDRFMNAAVTSAGRAASLTHRLLAFSRRQPLDPKPLDINRLVESIDDLLRRSLGERVELKIALGVEVWPALTDANQLENALLNLAINARDAMPHGGRLTIETTNVTGGSSEGRPDDLELGDYVLISVSDTGVGMSPETIAKAFDPFFTTKPIGQGTGLGLSMIYGFAKQSRGQVRIESTVGKGTAIQLYLPRYWGTLIEDHTAAEAVEAPHGAGETVLVVEDDSSVRLLIGEVLRELGYSCLEAAEGQAALPLLASNIRMDLMITDVGLPGLNGRQVAEIAREHRPGLRILFVTGYAEHATERGRFLGPGMDMITKPFTLDALAVKIREMIASASVTA